MKPKDVSKRFMMGAVYLRKVLERNAHLVELLESTSEFPTQPRENRRPAASATSSVAAKRQPISRTWVRDKYKRQSLAPTRTDSQPMSPRTPHARTTPQAVPASRLTQSNNSRNNRG